MSESLLQLMEEERIEARAEGREEGREEGRNLVNMLNDYLFRANRMDDLARSFSDKAFQQSLLDELFSRE